MNTQLFFIYDSHCPWSYVATPLVEQIMASFPDISFHSWHVANYQGEQQIGKTQLTAIKEFSGKTFTDSYIKSLKHPKDSVMVANVMAWISNKLPELTLPVLTAIQQQQFELGIELSTKEEFIPIFNQYKLSPPAKVLKNDKLTKEAEFIIQDALELQNLIGTEAIPALLLAIDDDLILLNHNLYLKNPKTITEAVTIERDKHRN